MNDIIKSLPPGTKTRSSTRMWTEYCNRRFIFSMIAQEYFPNEFEQKSDSLTTGSVFHALIEAHYLKLEDPVEFARAQFPDYPQTSDNQHNWEYVEHTFNGYKNTFPIEDEPDLFHMNDSPSLEYKWTDQAPIKNALFPDHGTIDRIFIIPADQVFEKTGHIPLNNQAEIWPCDIKTTTAGVHTPSWRTQFSQRLQFALYIRHLRETLNLNVGGFMVDGITHNKDKCVFARHWYRNEYNEENCNLLIAQSDAQVKMAFDNPEDTQGFKNCFLYRTQCPFHNVCSRKKYANTPIHKRLHHFIQYPPKPLTFQGIPLEGELT